MRLHDLVLFSEVEDKAVLYATMAPALLGIVAVVVCCLYRWRISSTKSPLLGESLRREVSLSRALLGIVAVVVCCLYRWRISSTRIPLLGESLDPQRGKLKSGTAVVVCCLYRWRISSTKSPLLGESLDPQRGSLSLKPLPHDALQPQKNLRFCHALKFTTCGMCNRTRIAQLAGIEHVLFLRVESTV